MTDPAAVRRIVATEVMISVLINALVPAAVIWLLGVRPPQRLGGFGGLVHGTLMASGLATFLMTLVLTNIVRARTRAGTLPVVPEPNGPARLLPASLMPRAIVLAVAAMLLLVPVGVAAAVTLQLLPLSTAGFPVFNILFGALVGLVMTPPLVRRALADPARRQ